MLSPERTTSALDCRLDFYFMINAGAPADCPLTYHKVPAGSDGKSCSGHGAAIYAQGVCQCYRGTNNAIDNMLAIKHVYTCNVSLLMIYRC